MLKYFLRDLVVFLTSVQLYFSISIGNFTAAKFQMSKRCFIDFGLIWCKLVKSMNMVALACRLVYV